MWVSKLPAILIVITLVAVASTASVRVTHSSTDRLTFVYELDTVEIGELLGEDGPYSYVIINGMEGGANSLQAYPLPLMPIHVGVPQTGNVSIEYSGEGFRTIKLDHPLPPLEKNGDSLQQFKNQWVSEPQYLYFRGLRAAQLTAVLARYHPETRTITIPERAVFTVRFPPSGPSSLRPSGGDYESMVKEILLNYETAKQWAPAVRGLSRSRSAQPHPLTNGTVAVFTRGDGHDGLRETSIDENGIIHFDGAQIHDLLGSISIEAVALYASTKGALGEPIPEFDAIPTGVVEIPLIRRDNNGNGRADAGDEFLAYVTGPSDWKPRASGDGFEFEIDPYEVNRYYWLARKTAGSGIELREFHQPAPQGVVHDAVPDGVYLRKFSGVQANQEGGTEWYWRKLTHFAGIFEQSLPLENVDTSVPCSLKISRGRWEGSRGIEFFINGESICDACNLSYWTIFNVDNEGRAQLRVRFNDDRETKNSYVEIEDVRVRYRKRLDMTGLNRLWIPSVGGSGTVGYRLEGISGKTYLLRIPEDESEMSLVAVLESGESSYTWHDTAGIGVRYFAARESSAEEIGSFRTVYRRMDVGKALTKPRRFGNAADLLIITPEGFVDQAVRLAEHKEAISRFSHARVIRNDDIFREFSGGRADPTAIRNMLAYASRHWQIAPEYVIFLGNGHYDYKQYITREPNHVLTYQKGEKCIEDYFVTIDPKDGSHNSPSMPDMFLGRIPCLSVSEARAAVDKIIEYEGPNADWGAWRNRVLMVADDDQQGAEQDRVSGHHISSEQVESAILDRRPSTQIDRLYLFEYPWDESWEKPQAKQALIDKLNSGVGFVNWFGHGSDALWADEHIFMVETIGALRQDTKQYPAFTSFSCSVGRFDIPDHTSLSDALVVSEGRGAIISIASTRKAYASQNTQFATTFYDDLFTANGFKSMGVAYARAKTNMGSDKNKDAYCFLGDPSLRCGPFSDSVSLEFYAKGEDKPLDTIAALQEVTIRGDILRSGILNPNFGTEKEPAWIEITMSNPPRENVGRKDGSSRTVTYELPGTEIYRSGAIKVDNGRFELTAVMPKRVIYDDPSGELRAYAYSGPRLGGGYKTGYVFHGTDTTDASRLTDTTGPSIRIRPLYGVAGNWNSNWNTPASFDDKIICTFPVNLEMVITDESGIDFTVNGPGEGVTYGIPGELPIRNVVESEMKITRKDDGTSEGTAQISLARRELEPGTYTMYVSAQDLLGMVSTDSIQLEVTDSVDRDFRLGHVFNYPNPVKMGSSTRFFFYPSGTRGDDRFHLDEQVQARIKIYTLSGKPVKVIENAVPSHEWDGTDQFGNPLSPNTYLYKVITWMPYRPESHDESEIRKLVIHPPR